jgi:hypothetical protein
MVWDKILVSCAAAYLFSISHKLHTFQKCKFFNSRESMKQKLAGKSTIQKLYSRKGLHNVTAM